MLRVLFALSFILSFTTSVRASTLDTDGGVTSTVHDVTSEYGVPNEHGVLLLPPLIPPIAANPTGTPSAAATPSPSSTPAATTTTNPNPVAVIPSIGATIQSGVSSITLDQLITLGGKIWDFVVSNRPTATYHTVQSSIVPAGITSWTQLRGWQRPVSKIYRVQFQTIFGSNAGSFDYRITFVPGGSYNGKGKFLGLITIVPMNIKLHTDRSLDVKAEMSEPINFGTEADPVAATQIVVSWSSPTTTRYQMNSASYFIYGTGEVEDITNGN